MTEAQFVSFVKSALRSASRRWKPISEIFKKAKVSRGIYHCKGCNQDVPVTIVEKGKRIKNVSVDHIHPIIDPLSGFVDWTSFIYNLFCEEDGLQLLCRKCHDAKTLQEREIATKRKNSKKNDNR